MKRMNKILFALFLAITTLVLGNNVVDAKVTAPSSIKMEQKSHHFKQWGDVRGFYFKTTTIGSKKENVSYCTNYNYTVPYAGKKLERTSEMDAGFAYLIANGYPNKKWFSSEYKNYYTTQLAIWYYNDGRTDIDFSKYSIVSKSSVQANNTWDLDTIKKIEKYAKDLSNKAFEAKKAGYTKPSIKINDNITFTLSNDGKYYVSNKVGVTATSVPGKYSVKLTGAPAGTIIANASGKATGDLKTSEKFMIKVPADKVTERITINVQISATGETNKAYNYKYNDNSNKWQKIMPALLYPVTTSVSAKKTVVVSPKLYNIVVVKKDTATGKALAGATMVLKNEKGIVVDTWVSTTGTHTTSGLLSGTYMLSESKAPNGYILNNVVEKITVSGATTSVTKEFYNTPKPVTYTLNVTKKDSETKEAIKGATLVIKQNNVTKKECVMTDTSVCSLSGLSAGTYTIEEKKAPEGYVLSTEIKTITLSGANTTKNVDFYNVKENTTGIAKISKQDITTKTELPGATLIVKDATGKEIERWVSSEDPHYITLEAGTYTLTEIQAPEGYILSTETITFVVKNDGTITPVVMYNKEYVPEPEPVPTPEPEQEEVVSVPKTGVNDVVKYLFSGLTSLLGLGLMRKNKCSK